MTKNPNTNGMPLAQNRCYQQCFLSDNLELMKTIESNTIDLIYCDILYGTGRKFKDYQDLKPIRSDIENHYIPRIKEMHRILKPTGSIYLQMDTKINHWIRIIMDEVFGYERMLNEIIWCYSIGGKSKNRYGEKHDIILLYSKTSNYIFNVEFAKVPRKPNSHMKLMIDENERQYQSKVDKKTGKEYVYYLDEGKIAEDYWLDINQLNRSDNQRNGYDTQKPKSLIERIVKVSSNEYDLIADFYAGSFTTAEVCKDLNRNFIGCDINPLALEISKQRLA